ncbi:hypothetical protein [Congzhengia minquanensis]|uniref:Uncharacterized protein n=1 Tax=Congzhengia minquanensis TaxID=2763657 RepID=A0A926HYZ4_9FIRM|nr:hypothetical protein [Congzhengia minquanensis]MBC8540918.1 hypothetical protein [Congzhengia minquanensis]
MTDNVITARTIDTICDINEDLKKALFIYGQLDEFFALDPKTQRDGIVLDFRHAKVLCDIVGDYTLTALSRAKDLEELKKHRKDER